MSVVVHPADIQDRDGAREVLRQARRLFPFVECIVGDGGYRGPIMQKAVARTGAWKLEIVKRSDLGGFKVLPKRWIVERTLCLAVALSPVGQGCRTLRKISRRVHPPRDDPNHAPALDRKLFIVNRYFPDRL